jgi:2,3-dihydroxybenzoate-AMP ligase
MLAGFVSWPTEDATRWKNAGYREGRCVADIVRDTADRMPDKVAVIEGQRRLSYAQLAGQVDRLAIELKRTGLKPLDRVVMQLPNSIEFVVSFLALMRLGAIPVMALRAHRYSEIKHFIDASGAVAYMVPGVFHQFDYRQLANEVQGACSSLTHVFVLDDALPGQHALGSIIDQAAQSQASLLDTEGATLDTVDPSQVALMLLSGGTTSLSKLIPRTHDDYVLNARLCGQGRRLRRSHGVHGHPAAGHNYNLASPGMLGCFYYGGTWCWRPRAMRPRCSRWCSARRSA